MSHKVFHLFVSLVLALSFLAVTPTPQLARAVGPWYVATTGDDTNDCLSPSTPCATIQGAISKASVGDTIKVSIGTYNGNINEPGSEVVFINKSINLSGGWDAAFTSQIGMSIIDGQFQLWDVVVSPSVVVSIEGFVIQNGFGMGYGGGGILNRGILTITNTTITSNNGGVRLGAGGGIRNEFGGILTINNSTIDSNKAYKGGGIFNACNGGNIILNGSTVRDNSVTGEGGGILAPCDNGSIIVNDSALTNNSASAGGGLFAYATIILNRSSVNGNSATLGSGGGIYSNWNLILNNSTVSGNKSQEFGGGIYHGQLSLFLNNSTISANITSGGGGGIFQGGHQAIFQNSIIAGNSGSNGADCAGNGTPMGTIVSAGYNLIGNLAGCDFAKTTGDLINVNGNLGDLVGFPGYHPLLKGSPAIDAGNPSSCTDQSGNLFTTDQRGATRPQGTRCDIGAFELEKTTIDVVVDIKPGSFPNSINPGSKGVVPVAVLTTDQFDASTLDPATVVFAGASPLRWALQDVDWNGKMDLLFHFETQSLILDMNSTEISLTGMTFDGMSVEGADTVKIILTQ